jgi:hypothetical protein
VRRALGDLPIAYARWIEDQRKVVVEPADRDTLDELVKRLYYDARADTSDTSAVCGTPWRRGPGSPPSPRCGTVIRWRSRRKTYANAEP